MSVPLNLCVSLTLLSLSLSVLYVGVKSIWRFEESMATKEKSQVSPGRRGLKVPRYLIIRACAKLLPVHSGLC